MATPSPVWTESAPTSVGKKAPMPRRAHRRREKLGEDRAEATENPRGEESERKAQHQHQPVGYIELGIAERDNGRADGEDE